MDKLIYGKELVIHGKEPLFEDPKQLIRDGRLWVDWNNHLLLDGKPLTITLAIELTDPSPNPRIQLLGGQGHKLAMFLQEVDKKLRNGRRSILFQNHPRKQIWNGTYGCGSRLGGLHLQAETCIDPILGEMPLIRGKCLVVLECTDQWKTRIYRNDPRRLAVDLLARGLDLLGYRLPNFFFWQLFTKLS